MPDPHAQPMRHRWGWKPDAPDPRDYAFAPPRLAALPPSVDLRPAFPAPYDQGQLGSCTANAIAGAIEFLQGKEKQPESVPSRLFIYYNERAIEGTVSEDSGAQIRDGVKSVATLGACAETLWPYDVSQFTVKPSDACYADALGHKVAQYLRLAQTVTDMQACLAAGYPFVFGFTVYASFESDLVAATGVVPMPATGEAMLGGHAVLAVGYDQAAQRFLVRNSWGATWGQQGYFTIPFDYLADPQLASDFWTIRLI